MKVGTFGGQIEALRREVRNIEQEERQRGNRRAFLGCLGGLAAGAAGLFGIQGAVKAKSKAKADPDAGAAGDKQDAGVARKPDRMEQLATGPLEKLLAERWAFLSRIMQGDVSPALAIGLTRLAHVATERTKAQSQDLGTYLLRVERQLPPEFGPLLVTLRDSRKKPEGK